MNGSIDEVHVYGRALSKEEVKALYKGYTTYSTNDISVKPVNPADADSDTLTTIVDWRRNGSSIDVLNMAFDSNITSLTAGAIKDYSSYGNNGQLGGGTAAYVPTWSSTDGVKGGYYSFDGTNDYIDTADINSLDGATQASAFLWMKMPALSGENDQFILSKWDYPTQGNFAISQGHNSDELNFYLATSLTDDGTGCAIVTTNTNLTTDTWYQIGFVFDGTQTGNANRLKVYVNGQNASVSQLSGNVPAALTSSGTATVKIGKLGGSMPMNFLGDIDESSIRKS
jgi:hypothetical protein